jgi:hypothetical protein
MNWRFTVKPILTILWTLAFLAGNSAALAYEVVEVSDGGAISGKITASGSIPANPQLTISKDTDLCGDSLTADYVIVDSSGGLKNAVVMLEGVAAGKDYDKKAVVLFDNVECMFTPHVAVAVKGQMLGVNNSDPILHNTHMYQGNNNRTLYNIALPLQDKVVKKPLRRPGKVTVKCDAHEWMLGYLYVSDNPYITVTKQDGSFSIDNVPAGTYKVLIWHETLGETTMDVTVTAGEQTVLDQSLSGPG